jgi:hypothetical protein
MKLWINFDEKDIKERKCGWSKGDDWDTQMIFEEEQDVNNTFIQIDHNEITLHFNNGYIKMTPEEFGGLFK